MAEISSYHLWFECLIKLIKEMETLSPFLCLRIMCTSIKCYHFCECLKNKSVELSKPQSFLIVLSIFPFLNGLRCIHILFLLESVLILIGIYQFMLSLYMKYCSWFLSSLIIYAFSVVSLRLLYLLIFPYIFNVIKKYTNVSWSHLQLYP